ncbi:MAG: hypothetical protein BGO55_12520 [Sphingobacteriales bacterium 50-39]|nr:RteC domain-containing protein [Sphingobacteriales bacterium]OJW57136.1 MAG: hypothetical protein BGO55_12520 [Sphingobacteriales bacterium 50-39]
MEAFLRELQMQLERDLDAISYVATPVKGYDIRIELVEAAVIRMKEYVAHHPFVNKGQEIEYFKCWSLPFIKLHAYYVTLYNFEVIRITTGKDELLQHIESEKRRIGAFFMAHQELYRYYRAGRTDEDEKYFTFRLPSRTSDFLIANSSFCSASLILGELLAYEEYRTILENEIDRIKDSGLAGKKIEIKVPKSAVAEVIVPIYELQWIWIDGRPATLNELIKMVEKGFNIDLKDFSVLDNANRYRKKSTYPNLEKMIRVWNDRRERLDP